MDIGFDLHDPAQRTGQGVGMRHAMAGAIPAVAGANASSDSSV